MRPEILVPAALALDALLGDPPRLPHPTRGMGALAARVETLLWKVESRAAETVEGADAVGQGRGDLSRAASRPRADVSRGANLWRGALAWLLVVGLSVLAGGGLMLLFRALGSLAARLLGFDEELGATVGGGAASAYLVYAAIAPRDLAEHALRVARALEEGSPAESAEPLGARSPAQPRANPADQAAAQAAAQAERLAEGRRAVSMIVGRDVERLDEAGVVRAAVESVAESAVDGVIAPLLWAFLLGPLGAVAYRAANTLDSMWGHRSERYLLFGRVAARADDALTWPAARLGFLASVLGVALCALWFRTDPRLSPRAALRIGLRDRRKHASPNSAWLEAAFAGALGIGLAGPAWYGGERLEKPAIGDPLRPPETADIRRSVRLMYASVLVFAALGAAALAALR